MRSAGNFHPEWGYLAPAPSFMRTARIALVATAIGATAGAGVVISLVGRSARGAGAGSIPTHALVTSIQAATPRASSAPRIAPQSGASKAAAMAPVPAPTEPAVKPPLSPPKQESRPAPGAGSQDATAESASPPGGERAAVPAAAPPRKVFVKKRRTAHYSSIRRFTPRREVREKHRDDRGFTPLFRLFSFRTGSTSYPN